ncbi:hypothetical protein BDZ91DRAFT_763354 [Kalaharituber pfeilii]|nr:hypothetical protein BDZ91DRAFT_763354 [Kalaharituber pfeilii]
MYKRSHSLRSRRGMPMQTSSKVAKQRCAAAFLVSCFCSLGSCFPCLLYESTCSLRQEEEKGSDKQGGKYEADCCSLDRCKCLEDLRQLYVVELGEGGRRGGGGGQGGCSMVGGRYHSNELRRAAGGGGGRGGGCARAHARIARPKRTPPRPAPAGIRGARRKQLDLRPAVDRLYSGSCGGTAEPAPKSVKCDRDEVDLDLPLLV